MSNMGELFYEARKYGRVYVHTADNGTYSVSIKFSTIEHVGLEASSGFNHKTVEKALQLALKKAIEIVESIKKMQTPDVSFTQKLIGVFK